MNSEEAQQWLVDHCNVSRETLETLAEFERAVISENESQNLISASTIPHFWNRHIVDSAQLLRFVGEGSQRWIDLGSGAGFPGLVVALMTSIPITLAEVRRKRADYLDAMVKRFDLSSQVEVVCSKVERITTGPYSIISARAFAPLDRLFSVAHHLSSPKTIWILPKGKSAASELEAARISWQGSFSIEPSVTDPEGAIVVATNVQPRRRR